jgi:hypothetical protein
MYTRPFLTSSFFMLYLITTLHITGGDPVLLPDFGAHSLSLDGSAKNYMFIDETEQTRELVCPQQKTAFPNTNDSALILKYADITQSSSKSLSITIISPAQKKPIDILISKISRYKSEKYKQLRALVLSDIDTILKNKKISPMDIGRIVCKYIPYNSDKRMKPVITIIASQYPYAIWEFKKNNYQSFAGNEIFRWLKHGFIIPYINREGQHQITLMQALVEGIENAKTLARGINDGSITTYSSNNAPGPKSYQDIREHNARAKTIKNDCFAIIAWLLDSGFNVHYRDLMGRNSYKLLEMVKSSKDKCTLTNMFNAASLHAALQEITANSCKEHMFYPGSPFFYA